MAFLSSFFEKIIGNGTVPSEGVYIGGGGGGGGGFDGGGSSIPGEDWPTTASNTTKATEVVQKVVASGDVDKFVAPTTSSAPLTKSNKDANTDPIDSSSGSSSSDAASDTDSFRVKVISLINPDDKIIFAVQPSLSEGRAVSYTTTDLIHHPGQMMIYRTTSPRIWTISGLFVSRTSAEASYNLKMLNIIRSWSLPYYGQGTANQIASRLGAPPDILQLTAYGANMIGPVPTVLTDASWTWPNDITYIAAQDANGARAAFPITLTISMTLTESFSIKEYSNFSLYDYKTGDMSKAYGGK